VQFRFKPWQLAAALVLVCAAAVGILEWRRSSQHYDASRLMQSLPVSGAVKVYVDLAAMRDAGLLDVLVGPKTVEDPDYRRLAEEIGFDYRTDLDAVAAAFVHGDFYAAARGHFDWKRLSEYALAQHGQCSNGVCNMPGDQPDRIISFYPLGSQVLALAVSDKLSSVTMIGPPTGKATVAVPPSAFWISAPGEDFKDLKNLPAGTQQFAAPLAQAREAAFGIQPAASDPSSTNRRFDIRMDVTCASPDAAAAMANVFKSLTDVLRSLIVSEHVAPKTSDLADVLVSGTFEVHDSSVTGRWPIRRSVIESLISAETK
jgi:hypothetical protein